MYSATWFDTFAATIPAHVTEAEADAIASFAQPSLFPRLLDLGCGVGRLSGPLSRRGYRVTGIDVNRELLRSAQRSARDATFVALDQRHVGRMRWEFDVAVSAWNSLGCGTREADVETLHGLGRVLRPGGRLLLDLFHPDWLRRNERSGEWDARGASVRRWVRDGRCYHEIRYPDGTVDDIQFNVYSPEEMTGMLHDAGFEVERSMTWWDPTLAPAADQARYELVCVRHA